MYKYLNLGGFEKVTTMNKTENKTDQEGTKTYDTYTRGSLGLKARFQSSDRSKSMNTCTA